MTITIHVLPDANMPGIHVYSLHPGVIASELGRHLDQTLFPGARIMFRFFSRPFIKNQEQGAQTTIHCATDEQAGRETGLYYK